MSTEPITQSINQRNHSPARGYKQTEVGVIPEDWIVTPLSSITSEISDGIHGTPIYSPTGEYYFINGNNLRAGQVIITDLTKSVSHSEYRKHKRNLGNRTILMSINGTIGSLGIYRGEPVILGKSAAYLNAREGVSKFYIYYSIQTKFVTRQFFDGLTGTTIGNLGLGTIRNTLIPLPPTKEEQRAIAAALSDADALIESLEQFIAKQRAVKQGAMQELLRPKGDWTRVKLGALGAFLKGSGVRKDDAQSGTIPCVRYGEIYTRHDDYIKSFYSFISPKVAATAKRLRYGDVLFAGSGETKEEIGKCVAFTSTVEAYAGGDIIILRTEKANSMFLGYYLNTPSINRQKASKGQGDAVVHISSAALADIEVIVPSTEEQTAIAAVLSDMDAEIDALEAKLAKACQVKQGMMQELLTGRTRLV